MILVSKLFSELVQLILIFIAKVSNDTEQNL